MQRRDRKILICLTDEEFNALDDLVEIYSLDGHRATKSFLVRYALKSLPSKTSLLSSDLPAVFPVSQKVRASNTAL